MRILHYYLVMFLYSLFLKAHFEVIELVDICISTLVYYFFVLLIYWCCERWYYPWSWESSGWFSLAICSKNITVNGMRGKDTLQTLSSSYFSKFIWNAVTLGENSDCVLNESLKNSLFTIYCFGLLDCPRDRVCCHYF